MATKVFPTEMSDRGTVLGADKLLIWNSTTGSSEEYTTVTKLTKIVDDKISASQGNLLGGIAFDAAAPTPAANGRYVFTSAGSCTWITGGAVTVAVNDEVLVTYTAPSTYVYTYLSVSSDFIRNSGDDTIAGIKTFSSSPIVPTPTTDLQVSTKKYVDDGISDSVGGFSKLNSYENDVFSSISEWTSDGYIAASNGEIVITPSYRYSEFYPITPSLALETSGMTGSVSVIKIAFYDKAKILLPSGNGINESVNFKVVTPNDARFVRFCAESTATTASVKVVQTMRGDAAEDSIILRSKINQLQSDSSDVVYDSADFTNSGYLSYLDGVPKANADYAYTDYKGIIAGQRIFLTNMAGSSAALKIAYYDRRKALMLSVSVNTSSTTINTIVPSGAYYARFCYEKYASGVERESAKVEMSFLFRDGAFVAKYTPISQYDRGHSIATTRTADWLFTAVRTQIYESKLIANIIKVPMYEGMPLAVEEYKLLIATSAAVVNPSLMLDITSEIDSVTYSRESGKHTIIKLSTPRIFEYGQVIVFAFKKRVNTTIYISMNGTGSVDGKLQFLFSTSATAWTANWSASSGTDNPTPAMVLLMDEKYEVVDSWKKRNTNLIAVREDFTTAAGATTQTTGEIELIGSGSHNPCLIYNTDTYIEQCRLTASVKITELSAGAVAFSLGKYTGTTYAEMRITQTDFELWYQYSGGGWIKYFTQSLGAISVAAGKEIGLNIIKVADQATFEITDGVTTITKAVTKIASELLTMLWGKPYVSITSGKVLVRHITFGSPYSVNAKLGIWGDSFIEGSSLISAGLENRYCAKIAADIGVLNCAIFGKGGQSFNTTWFSNFVKENEWYRTNYALIALGTNNSDYAAYKLVLDATIEHLKNKGQVPVLATVTPHAGNLALVPLANAYIRGLGERYIDINKAVTEPADELVWKSGLVMGDGVHPTVAGQLAMYNRVKLDLMDILAL